MIRANGMTPRHSPMGGWLGIMATMLIASRIAVAAGEGVFDVREYGAAGDGKTLDTAAINKAVETCAQSGGGPSFWAALLPVGAGSVKEVRQA